MIDKCILKRFMLGRELVLSKGWMAAVYATMATSFPETGRTMP